MPCSLVKATFSVTSSDCLSGRLKAKFCDLADFPLLSNTPWPCRTPPEACWQRNCQDEFLCARNRCHSKLPHSIILTQTAATVPVGTKKTGPLYTAISYLSKMPILFGTTRQEVHPSAVWVVTTLADTWPENASVMLLFSTVHLWGWIEQSWEEPPLHFGLIFFLSLSFLCTSTPSGRTESIPDQKNKESLRWPRVPTQDRLPRSSCSSVLL